MNKLFAAALTAAAVGCSLITAAQAMPFGNTQTQDSLVVQVAGGCGAGFHRGPYGRCRPNGYYGGVYYGAAAVAPRVVAPPVVVAPACRRVCNPYRCWRVC
jgi:hypothetical protein